VLTVYQINGGVKIFTEAQQWGHVPKSVQVEKRSEGEEEEW